MKINGKHYRSISIREDGQTAKIFDQRKLPWELVEVDLVSAEHAAQAIKEMWTRGAPMIAMTGVFGLCLALREDASHAALMSAYDMLVDTRPTAVNLKWALDKMLNHLEPLAEQERASAAFALAKDLCDEDVRINKSIGENGLAIIQQIAQAKGDNPVNILTHCNAGWLATVDYGTATSPIYQAHDLGIPIHVWVDETRPRNQGAFLTAFELSEHGVPHKVITDNAGGHMMQTGQVDMCIVGADRVTANGDVCNKIGTYLKALAAHDNDIPFYVALPYPTIDMSMKSGKEIPIEERSELEVTHLQGLDDQKQVSTIQITRSQAANPGFDITPARLVTGYITDRGVFDSIDQIDL